MKNVCIHGLIVNFGIGRMASIINQERMDCLRAEIETGQKLILCDEKGYEYFYTYNDKLRHYVKDVIKN